MAKPRAGAAPMFMLLHSVLTTEREALLAALRARGFADVSLAEIRVLHELRSGPRSIQALAAVSGTTKQHCAREIAKLDRKGIVLVQDSLTDGRAREVSLTDDGLRALEVVRLAKVELDRLMTRRLGVGDSKALRRILTRLAARP